jgi:enoyl-[acyl-carrier-protein] reductase (NADH)
VWLTHRWGSAAPDEIEAQFAEADAPRPRVIEADVGNDEDTKALIETIAIEHRTVDLFVSNACVAALGGGVERLRRRDFARCLDYSAWPLLSYLDAMHRTLGRLPRRVIAMSSDGVIRHFPRYDYVALSKAALEAVAALLSARPSNDPTRMFVLRTAQSTTGGFAEIFPEAARRLLERFATFAVAPQQVGDAVVALASGHLDGLHGGVLTVDHGSGLLDNTMTAGALLAEVAP